MYFRGLIFLFCTILCINTRAQEVVESSFSNFISVNLLPLPANNTLQLAYERNLGKSISLVVAPKMVLANRKVDGHGLEGQVRLYWFTRQQDRDFYFEKSSMFYSALFFSYDELQFKIPYTSQLEKNLEGFTFGFVLGSKIELFESLLLDLNLGMGIGSVKDKLPGEHEDWNNLQLFLHPMYSGVIVKTGVNVAYRF